MKVLLAIDGSPCSQAAVEEVINRIWPGGSEIKVISAVHVLIPDIPDAPLLILYPARMELMENERKRMSELVERTAARLRESEKDKDIKVYTQVTDGAPKDVLIQEAERWKADLIIVGCHGYGNIHRFLLGSVSQTVAIHAPCSVEIVRAHHSGK